MSASISQSVSSESIASDGNVNGVVDSATQSTSGSLREECRDTHDTVVVSDEGKLAPTSTCSDESRKSLTRGLGAISRGIAARFLPRGRVTKPTDSQTTKPPPTR